MHVADTLMMEKLIELNDALDTAVFYGVNNRNMLCFKSMFPAVKIVARGSRVKLSGTDADIRRLEDLLHYAERFCVEHGMLDEQHIASLFSGQHPHTESHEDLILHGVNGKPVTAKTPAQRELTEAFANNDLLFAVGPAGTGKTYTAIALAVRALKNKEVRKIVLSRPAVEAGEKLGFLPGDMKEKVDPYLQPLYDALEDMLPPQKLQEYIERGVIQIAPLAFMRGRTLSDAVVVLDEAQNTTVPQIKMFLTRLGLGGKMIVTGDLTQIDLPASQRSGLRDAITTLEDVKGISFVYFTQTDIVRHPLVTKIVRAYENKTKTEKTATDSAEN